ncbi:odorant receptor 2a [Drosophila grimshawi]|uniref:odorant receptor 2a n=1 Tax=Drosophila grimshawi TaxID=7222 RepID=UPI0013EF45AF|nr:odorant receptor 2a [Drosophila grimshawi]
MEKLMRLTQHVLSSNAAEGKIGSIEMNLWLAQLVGLPLFGLKPETPLQSLIIISFGGLVQSALFCYLGLELYDLYLNWQNLDALTQNIVLSLTHAVYWLKVFNICYHYTTLKDIINKFRDITRRCILSEKQRETFQRAEIESKSAMLLYFSLVLLPGAMGTVYILIAPDNFAGDRFPYRAAMPDFLPPVVQYLYKGLGVAVVALDITQIDYMNVSCMVQLCMHLKVINLAFDELLPTDQQKLREDPNNWLVSIVKYHCELIVLRQKVERIFNLPVMLQFVSSVVIVAMTVFQVLVIGDGSTSSIIMDMLLCCVLCQLFFYCWFGNEVYEQSMTLATSGFGCNWYLFDTKFRKTLLIFMVNAERPFLFTAGGFMGLHLPSFTYIISKAYSIMAVLRQMYSRP